MKRIFFIGSLLSSLLVYPGLFAQSNLASTEPQSTITPNTRQGNPTRPNRRKNTLKPEPGMDSTAPKNRKQPRLRPDSLRRGGATRVDTVR